MAKASQNFVRTECGEFRRCEAGIWHYSSNHGASISRAATDAIDNIPGEVGFFWFCNSFAPIYMKDTYSTLARRWEKWNKTSIQASPLMKMFEGLRA